MNPANLTAPKRTKSTRLGAAVDRLVFGIGDELVIKERRGQPELPGQILLSPVEFGSATTVAYAVCQEWPRASSIHSKNQYKLIWNSDVECSATPDNLDTEQWQINDLKTSYDVSDEAITDAIKRYGYDLQAAACIEGAIQVLNWPRPTFRNVFVCTKEPYQVKFWTYDTETIERGQELWNEAKRIWAGCLKTGDFPDTARYTPPAPRFKSSSKTVDEFMSR